MMLHMTQFPFPIPLNYGQQPSCLHFEPTQLKSNGVRIGQCWKVSKGNLEAGRGIIQGLRFKPAEKHVAEESVS